MGFKILAETKPGTPEDQRYLLRISSNTAFSSTPYFIELRHALQCALDIDTDFKGLSLRLKGNLESKSDLIVHNDKIMLNHKFKSSHEDLPVGSQGSSRQMTVPTLRLASISAIISLLISLHWY
mgnify:CR=1 FL=1